MPAISPERSVGRLAPPLAGRSQDAPTGDRAGAARGFGRAQGERGARRRSGGRRRPALSANDWGPLGKHPDREAIVARQRLHLPLAGRIGPDDVNRAWKSAAAQHHPDRGGSHDTMQRVNGARDLLLGRSSD